MTKLFIAEKPSLGRAIADNLPGTQQKGDGYIKMSNGDIVSWAAGHLWEQQEPGFYANGKNTFDIANLPLIPAKFELRPRVDPKTKSDSSAKKQLKILGDLLSKCTSVVHVGDPDREGQAIVDNILIKAKNNKPVERVWLSAMDASSVKKALATMKPNNDPLYKGMYKSAVLRAEGDWLVGMNLSPAISHAARKSGYQGFISIGRVQTPTLALVVNRDNEIENFKPKDYFVVGASVKVAGGEFGATYKIPDNMQGLDSEGRIASKAAAEEVANRVRGKQGTITKYETKREKESAPLPFSLSSLQIYASSKFGYGAQQVLDTCQSLYETHALTSYPRTDSEFLPESQHGDGGSILSHLGTNFSVAQGGNASLKSRMFNDKKVTAHHAIIPTGKKANLANLSPVEKNIYEAIAMRYVANFYPDYVYDKTNVEATFNGKDAFTASGRVDVSDGWRKVIPPEKGKKDEDAKLPGMKQGESATAQKASVDSKQTKPPAYFTEGTLIEAMTNVHKYVTNPEVKKRLKEVAGIGTEATRANIIERLFARELFVKDGKKIKSSGAAKAAIAGMPAQLTDPGITAFLEEALEAVASGKLDEEKFIAMRDKDIKSMVEWGRNNALHIPKEFHGTSKSSPKPGGKGGSKSSSGYPSKPAGKSTPINVPFDDKEEAKSKGARWDGDKKTWVIPEGVDKKPFEKWMGKKDSKPPAKASGVKL